jgi:tRNA-dihydrouridine synthase B
MIGRAAQGRPWLCGQIAAHLATGITPPDPTREEQLAILRGHVRALHDFYGEFMGVRIARKHVAWYLQNRADCAQQRSAFNRLEQAAEQLHFLQHLTESPIHQDYPHKELAA